MAENKESEVTAKEVVSDTPAATSFDTKKKHFNFKKPTRKQGILYVMAVLIVVGLGYFFANGGFGKSTVNIGGNKVSKQAVSNFAYQMSVYQKANPGVSFGNDLNQYAADRLILNAALKLEAKQRNITVNDTDLAQAVGRNFTDQQSATAYVNSIRASAKIKSLKVAAAGEIQLVNMENVAYQAKLQNKLINKENLTLVTMILDTPFFNSLPQNQVQGAYDQAQARMKNVFLPLVAQRKSVQAISQKADISYNNPATTAAADNAEALRELKLYYAQGVVSVSQLNGYQKGITGFNDNNTTRWIRGNLGTIQSTTDEVDKLKNVGDNTGVFASKAGALMIIRLDSKTGGAYSSWADFLNTYKQKYAAGKLQVAATAVGSTALGLANKLVADITTPGLQQTQAFSCADTSHQYTLTVVAWDQNTGAPISGARLVQHRAATGSFTDTDSSGNVQTVTGANQCASPGNRTLTSDNNVGGAGYVISDGSNTLSDDCFGLPPTFSSASPSSYWQPARNGSGTNAKWQHPNIQTGGGYNPGLLNGYPDPPNSDGLDHIRPGLANFNSYYVVLEYFPHIQPCLPCQPCDTTCHNPGGGGEAPFVDPECTNLTVDNNTYDPGGGAISPGGDYTATSVTVANVGSVSGPYINANTGTAFSASYNTGANSGQNQQWTYRALGNITVTISKKYLVPVPPPGHADNMTSAYGTGQDWAPNVINVTCSPPPQPPVGYIDGAQCINGISGWAQDPDNGGAIEVAVFYKQGQTTDPSGATPYGYGAGGDGAYLANGARGDPENGHGFTIPMDPGLLDGNRYSFFVTAYGIDTSGNQDFVNANLGNSSATANTMLGCAPFTTTGSSTPTLNPSTEDPATYSTSSNGNVAYGAGVAPGFNPGISMGCNVVVTANGINPYGGPQNCAGSFTRSSTTVTGPSGNVITPVTAGDVYCSFLNLQYSSGIVQEDGAVYNTSGWGSFGGSCPKVDNKPFFKVMSGDVSAGGAFSSVGNPNCSGGGVLAGWNNNSGTNPPGDFGASAQIGALALGPITGFASNQSAFNNSPTGLSFANTVAGDKSIDAYSPKLGGNFNTAAGAGNCFTNVSVPTGGPVAGPVSIGTTVISPGASQNQSVFVNGDVYITGNILYKGDNGATGAAASWTSQSHVPSFVVHATGDIKISPNVTELDGLYESAGKIYTCAPAASGAVPDSFISNSFVTCNNQLTVYGKFVASQVNMGRTLGSLRDETPTPGSGGSPSVSGATAPLVWSYGGSDPPPPSGYTCIPVHEASPPQPFATAWGDNQLCVKNDLVHQAHLGWTTNAVAPEDPGAPPPQDPSRTGLPTCTASWGSVVAPYGYPHDQTTGFWWDDNYLCSDAARLSFVIQATNPSDANNYCTPILEPSDPNGGGLFQGTNPGGKPWVCISKYVPSVGATSGSANVATPCSNQGVLSSSVPTCAAEVFYSTPELYLSTPNIGKPSLGAQQWDAITSLPPLL